MEDVKALCKRVIIVNQGQVMYDGKLKQLLDQYIDHKLLEVTFTEDVAAAEIKPLGVVKERSARRVVLAVPKSDAKKVATHLLTKFPVNDILINEVDVEEVSFEKYLRKRL